MLVFCFVGEFVQLLDGESSFGIPAKQHAQALAADKPILQWRDNKLKVDDIKHDKQKTLLEGKTVCAMPLSDFARHLRDAVLRPAAPPPPKDDMVFIHATREDLPHAESLQHLLEQEGYGTWLPSYEGEPSEIRGLIAEGFELCNVWLMLQKNALRPALDKNLMEAMRHRLKRPEKPTVLLCHPASAEPPRVKLPGMITLDCVERFENQCAAQLGQVKK